MRREKGSLLAVPVEFVDASPPETFLPISEVHFQQVHSKLILVNNNDVSWKNLSYLNSKEYIIII